MSELEGLTCRGVSCDGTGCAETITGPALPHAEGQDVYTRRAVARGWTVWVGRSRRHYCPKHKPAPGHRMHDITAKFAVRSDLERQHA